VGFRDIRLRRWERHLQRFQTDSSSPLGVPTGPCDPVDCEAAAAPVTLAWSSGHGTRVPSMSVAARWPSPLPSRLRSRERGVQGVPDMDSTGSFRMKFWTGGVPRDLGRRVRSASRRPGSRSSLCSARGVDGNHRPPAEPASRGIRSRVCLASGLLLRVHSGIGRFRRDPSADRCHTTGLVPPTWFLTTSTVFSALQARVYCNPMPDEVRHVSRSHPLDPLDPRSEGR